MNVSTSVVVFLKPSDLNDGTTPADRFSPGEKAIYRGPPQPIYYGLSNPFKVNLEPGHTVVICKNQFTNRRDYDPSGKNKGSFILHAHVSLGGTPKEGSTEHRSIDVFNHNWKIQQADICNCIPLAPIDPRKPTCEIS